MKTPVLHLSLILGSAALIPLSALAASSENAATTTPAPANPVVAPAAPAPAPDRTVYAPRLPSAQELTQAAAAQGLSIAKIEQSDSEVTVVYQLSDGRTNTVAYRLLAAADSAVATTAPVPAPVRRTVVYTETQPDVIYYEPVRRVYDPWYYYPPVNFSFGFDYVYHSGHRHHHRDFDRWSRHRRH